MPGGTAGPFFGAPDSVLAADEDGRDDDDADIGGVGTLLDDCGRFDDDC